MFKKGFDENALTRSRAYILVIYLVLSNLFLEKIFSVPLHMQTYA